tara:strand:- start:959 stop:1444 length:486 start_codon:yes stop_codon:yes gene_type:complete
MNEVDTAILAVTVLSFIFGLWRGLVNEVLSLVTWIAALLVARVYSEYLAGLLVNFLENDSVRYVTAFALIFVIVMMLGTLLNRMLSKLLTITGFKFVDRLLGGVFGIARGLIIVLFVVFISSVFVSQTEQWQQSVLMPYALVVIEWSRIFINDMNSINLGQ